VATGRDAGSRTDRGSAALTPAGFRAMVGHPGAGGGLRICYVDLEHPELGPSMLSEGSNATERKADREHHPDGRIILSNFFRLAGFPAPRSEAAALARA
jgi:hypothetical protein